MLGEPDGEVTHPSSIVEAVKVLVESHSRIPIHRDVVVILKVLEELRLTYAVGS